MCKKEVFTPPSFVKKSKLSIITINYNNRDGLLRTIKSVAGQTCRDFEYIVIDGGSTDGSVDVIKEYADYIDYWVSESDKGIYNAMNKGVRAAHGEFCQFLNSGDWFINNSVIALVFPELNSLYDIITGYVCCRDGKNRMQPYKLANPQKINSIFLLRYTLSHQSMFIKTERLQSNPYDESYRIAADYKFIVDGYFNHDYKFNHIENCIANYDLDGISVTNTSACGMERTKIQQECINLNLLCHEISVFPPEILPLWNEVKYNFKFQKFLITVNKSLVRIYKFFR